MLSDYLKLNIFVSMLRKYLAAFFASQYSASHLSMLDPEPCVWRIERKKKCNQDAAILCEINLVSSSGQQLQGVRKLCLTHASHLAVNKYLVKALGEFE